MKSLDNSNNAIAEEPSQDNARDTLTGAASSKMQSYEPKDTSCKSHHTNLDDNPRQSYNPAKYQEEIGISPKLASPVNKHENHENHQNHENSQNHDKPFLN